jgi:hypothetical protein
MKWGNVEWYHDLDIEELQAKIAAAALFAKIIAHYVISPIM